MATNLPHSAPDGEKLQVVAGYIETGTDSILALFHAPAPGRQRDAAILIVPPFGWEDVCAYRSLRVWAQSLAAAGYATLRLDLPRTGDAAGTMREAGCVAAWTRAIADAADELRRLSGTYRVIAVGIRLGAMLALEARVRGARIDALALWAPSARGSTLLRELRALGRFETQSRPSPALAEASAPDGSIESAGFVLSREAVGDLGRLDFARLAFERPAPDVLVIERDGMAAEDELVVALRNAGTSVEVAAAVGYGALMADPQNAVHPQALFAIVNRWLDSRTANSFAKPVRALLPTHEGSAGAHRWREAPLFIDTRCGRTFGITCQPLAPPSGDLGVLMLNAGALRRIGPGRLWVDAARRLAARGVPSARLDLERIGDSGGDAGSPLPLASLYKPSMLDQIQDAMDALGPRLGVQRFALFGVCAGAYWAFHTALADPRVASIAMLNPSLFFWDAHFAVLSDAREAAASIVTPASWQKLKRGDVPLRRIGEIAYVLAARSALAAARLPGAVTAAVRARRDGGDALVLALDQLHKRGVFALLAFGDREPLLDDMRRGGYLDRLARWPNLSFEILPGADHLLRPMSALERVFPLLDSVVDASLGRPQYPAV